MRTPNDSRSKRNKPAANSNRRVSAYRSPPPSRVRRILRKIFNGWTFSLAALFLLASFFTLTYYWFEFSDRVDRRLLSGDVFTASAGIYSAPKTLRENEAITPLELIAYLKSAGYIEKNNRADADRSRYSFESAKLTIEPGLTGIIDGKKVYQTLEVTFSNDLKAVAKITDLGTSIEMKTAALEPKILSTIAGEGDGRRTTVKFADLPPHLVKAMTVTEDRAFFDHYGVNFRGIARALWRRYEGEDDSPIANQGGSSITQQLVKNLFLTNEQTIERKITEAFMSIIIETRLTKEEIFTLYANQIYLGQQTGVAIYGVGEASGSYFGKDVSQLTLPESAFLAGILRSPNRYNPYKNVERVRERRNQVLDSMRETETITEQQYLNARNTPLELRVVSAKDALEGMPYFSQYIVDELPKIVGDPEALQHLRVYTSIDPDLQRIAYKTVSERLAKIEKLYKKQKPGNLNAALVAIRPKTGEIVAMVGGRDYLDNQFNRATSAMRQPGSVFKPFVYAAAINSAYEPASRVFTAATVFKDEKKVFTFDNNSYAPNNYGDSFSNREITLRDALVRSKNTITVDLAMQLNIGRVMNLAARAGLPRVERAYPSMALGTAEATPLQVATGFSVFANQGDRVLPMPITKVTKGDGTTTVAPMADRQNVLRPEVAFIMNDIMKDVINRGTAASAQAWGLKNVDGKSGIAGKTGTSRDGWFAGYTPELVCVVYVGFDNNDDLGLKGSDSAMPIWADFMRDALKLHPEWSGDWAMPAMVRKAEIDIRDGSLVQELDGTETVSDATAPEAAPSPADASYDDPAWATIDEPVVKQIFVTDIPTEFKRVEYFIGGTIPNRKLITNDDDLDPVDLVPEPDPTPINETWQEKLEQQAHSPPTNSNVSSAAGSQVRTVLLSICPANGLRASVHCPIREPRRFVPGQEPRDYCAIHR
ncbi:MAG: PBP1A family penicillin-binding protein [Blastocatellia bacterium]|nr:PBP1A family penicillin-binding protein [Blastocatellia bacterium]